MVYTINDKIDIDEVLIKFSIFGKYHISCLFLFLLINIFTAVGTVNYVFVAEEVSYSCRDYEIATCKSFNSTHRCSEWIYENPNSLIAEFGLACQEWKRTMIGSVHSVGYMVGLIFIGPLSDRIGRKYAVILTVMASAVLGVGKSFTTTYWTFVVLEFLEAMAGTYFSPVFMMVAEFVATKHRITYMTFCNIGWYIGYTLFAPIAWYFTYWRTLLRVIYGPCILFFAYKYLLDESPRWLLSKGRQKEAVKILENAAKRSKLSVEKSVLENITYNKVEELSMLSLLKNTFKSKVLRKRFFVCVVWWTTAAFNSYGLMINSVSLQGNKYLNFAILSVIDIPAVILNMVALKLLKRKLSLILTFFTGGVLCLSQPFIPNNLTWLSITVYMAGKMLSTCYFDTIYLYTSELFPTYTRNSMHALCSSLGRIGSVIAPQTPLLMVYWTGLPSVVFGCTAVVAGLLTFLVPDTSKDSLPDTVTQAEALGTSPKKKYNAAS